MTVGAVVVARRKLDEVMNEVRRLLQVRWLELRDLRYEKPIGPVRQLLNEAAGSGHCGKLLAISLEGDATGAAVVTSIPPPMNVACHVGLGVYRNRPFSAIVVAKARASAGAKPGLNEVVGYRAWWSGALSPERQRREA